MQNKRRLYVNIQRKIIILQGGRVGFLKFYYSAKLLINSTYNVDEKSETEEWAIFSRALLSKLLTSQRKKSQKLL